MAERFNRTLKKKAIDGRFFSEYRRSSHRRQGLHQKIQRAVARQNRVRYRISFPPGADIANDPIIDRSETSALDIFANESLRFGEDVDDHSRFALSVATGLRSPRVSPLRMGFGFDRV